MLEFTAAQSKHSLTHEPSSTSTLNVRHCSCIYLSFFSRLIRILNRNVVQEREFDFHEGARAAVGVAGQCRTEFSRFEVIMGAMMMSLMAVINQPKCNLT